MRLTRKAEVKSLPATSALGDFMLSEQPDHEAIARLAQSYWEQRNGEGGSPEEDWYRAEAELRRHLLVSSAD